MISDDLRKRRLKIIKEHMDTEVTQEFDLTLATFNGHPRYEIVPTGQVFDGADEVMSYYRTTRAAFPDQRHGNVRCHAVGVSEKLAPGDHRTLPSFGALAISVPRARLSPP